MKKLCFVAILLPCLCFADQPFFEGTIYSTTNVVGWIRQACADKTAAAALLAKYTNSVSGIAKGYAIAARLHTCRHDKIAQSCGIELLCGKSLEAAWASAYNTNLCAFVELIPQGKDNQCIKDNPPFFRIPCTALSSAATINKIVAEEFAGKSVLTNVAAQVDAKAEVPK